MLRGTFLTRRGYIFSFRRAPLFRPSAPRFLEPALFFNRERLFLIEPSHFFNRAPYFFYQLPAAPISPTAKKDAEASNLLFNYYLIVI